MRLQNPRLIAFAGIYERWRDPQGGEIETVAILTCPANRTVAVHTAFMMEALRKLYDAEDLANELEGKKPGEVKTE